MTRKSVWLFNEETTDMNDLLGTKGVNLHNITQLNLPVPPGFTITCDTCINFLNNNNKLNKDTINNIKNSISIIEKDTGKIFGNTTNPLLFSMRVSTKFPTDCILDELYKTSNSTHKKRTTPLYILQRTKNNLSMPGIPETILNLGLNDEIINNRIKLNDNPIFWYDCYSKLLSSYGSVVLGLNKLKYFDIELENIKKIEKVNNNSQISIGGYKSLIDKYKKIIIQASGKEFPQDSYTQLINTIEAIYKCWNNPLAVKYREQNRIPHNCGCSISIQTMVFGNKDFHSATGILATRNPSTGENELYGEYLIKAQGEDIVKSNSVGIKQIENLQYDMPKAYKKLLNIIKELEKINKTSQEIEFTIESDKLWILKTRNGKTHPNATLKIALDMVKEKLISKSDAITNITPSIINKVNYNDDFKTFIKWLDETKQIKIGANIYHSEEISKACLVNSDMVGLCRTECLLPNNKNVINSWVYNLVNAKTKKDRYNVLQQVKEQQYSDYYEMLKNFDNKIFTFRLSDYPLEEFFPNKNELLNEIIIKKANNQNTKNDDITYKFLKKISNTNPMLGLRGSRLAIIYPELYEIQLRALFEAACDLKNEGHTPIPYIMTSFISHVNELEILKKLIETNANLVMRQKNIFVDYKIGTMIEIPRAALTAGEIAKQVDFFSFGTNDLTQMTSCYSRNNYNYINKCIEENIIAFNPFIKLDKDGTGQLIKMATINGKNANQNLICGICGIQMRDPDSVKYAIENGIDYISIDTDYIPQAKLIAAQLAIKRK